VSGPLARQPRNRRLTDVWRSSPGYQWIQGTKPQTLAYALTDSPAGLAAWIAEKFRTWSDWGSDIHSAIIFLAESAAAAHKRVTGDTVIGQLPAAHGAT
jgi:hypothetical protein